MGLTLIEAVKLIKSGESEDYLKRFVNSVQAAAFSAQPVAINLDDALVASLVLTKLADSADGRKLLKKPKRKNTQYKADAFNRDSPQGMIARDVVDKKINYPEALSKLDQTFDGSADKERTLKRLLDDLIRTEENRREALANALAICGWDGSEETSDDAINRFMSVLDGNVPGSGK